MNNKFNDYISRNGKNYSTHVPSYFIGRHNLQACNLRIV